MHFDLASFVIGFVIGLTVMALVGIGLLANMSDRIGR